MGLEVAELEDGKEEEVVAVVVVKTMVMNSMTMTRKQEFWGRFNVDGAVE